MKTGIYFISLYIVLSASFSCSPFKFSKYSAFNKFYYANEQPRFNFQNDSLKIEGAWHWATSARTIPKISFIPEIPMQLLKPIAREHGAVLFATWTPERKKYSVEGFVPVTKADVRFNDPSANPLFLIVLITNHAFKTDTSKYKPHGRNNDYQFDLYTKVSRSPIDNYWVMEVIASSKNRHYNFVCIRNDSSMNNPESRGYVANLFFEDIQQRFLTK